MTAAGLAKGFYSENEENSASINIQIDSHISEYLENYTFKTNPIPSLEIY